MSKFLNISNKLISLKQRILITDDSDVIQYECTWRFKWFSQPWVLMKNGKEVAVFKRKLWTFRSILDVNTEDGDYCLRRTIFSLLGRIVVEGGQLDGAVFTRSFLGGTATLTHSGFTLAKMQRKLFSMGNKHVIELINETPQVELLMVILMVQEIVIGKGTQKHTQPSYAY